MFIYDWFFDTLDYKSLEIISLPAKVGRIFTAEAAKVFVIDKGDAGLNTAEFTPALKGNNPFREGNTTSSEAASKGTEYG